MIVYEFKIKAQQNQYISINEAIRIGQFIRNKCVRFWMDSSPEDRVNNAALCRYITTLYEEFPFVVNLNSMARQASVERAWFAISRFYDNCKKKVAGKKGYPQFKKFSRSIEYKTSGWKLSGDRKYLTITDKTGIGTLKLIGTYDLNYYQLSQIKRVRLIRRADGYYAQFCIDQERLEDCTPTGQAIGLDVGLESFFTDSNGQKVENPRFLRKSERKLKTLQKRLSRTKKGSKNRRKAHNRLARKHLQVQRQRKDFAVKQARCVSISNDIVAIENLNVKGIVRNHKLAKSISDASWSMFRQWLEYFCHVFSRELIIVNPAYTSQDCSSCGERVKKSLSTRTHICKCGCVLDRDENAAINILAKGLNTVGRTVINASGQTDLCSAGVSLQSKPTGRKKNPPL